ncbi:MAG: Tat protein [Rhizobiaceae bacterium MnEN-MB40S]|nr:MAG: Tat protein [Rhizobiaceae bacterium MnEN-MB40S]
MQADKQGDTALKILPGGPGATRRGFLAAMGGAFAAGVSPVRAAPPATPDALNAVELGLTPDSLENQGPTLEKILNAASDAGVPVFIPPGDFVVSNVTLPALVHLRGVPGLSRLIYGGGDHFLRAENASDIRLAGLTLDASGHRLADDCRGAVEAVNTVNVDISGCAIVDSRKHGVALEACGGSITGTSISATASAGIYCVDGSAVRIADNRVFNCGNGGVLVHRWRPGPDGAIVSGNRVTGIRADDGGTGQHGNGINVYQADNVMITGNHVADCAFSAIRSNSGSGVQIVSNQCLASGETAIYSEFAFQGAIVANNLVDGAANGISIANFNQGGRLAVVSGNIIRNIVNEGPYDPVGPGFGWGIAAEADTSVNGNVLDTIARFGMLIGWGPYLRGVSVTDNIVRNSLIGVAVTVVDGAEATQIANNIFQNTLRGAIVGYRWQERITRDMIAGGAQDYPHLTVFGNTQL